jgi:hypothetical protein
MKPMKTKMKLHWWKAAGVALLLAGQALCAAQQAGNIVGIVKDEQGSPLADVKIQMCGLEKLDNGNWRRELRLGMMPAYSTDKDGRFVVPVNEADMRFDFYCDKPGYAPTFLYCITNPSPELNVVMKRGLTVTGTVKRMAGGKLEPVSGTQVELRLPYEDLWYQQDTSTDNDGKYTFHVSPPDHGMWQVVFSGEVVKLDVAEGQPVKGPDFEVAVIAKTPQTNGN